MPNRSNERRAVATAGSDRRTGYPERHDAAKETGEGCAHPDVSFERLAVEHRVGEGGYVELASAHKPDDEDGQNPECKQ